MQSNWTLAARKWVQQRLPFQHLLPDEQPSYVRSFVYLFGALTLASLAVVIASGIVLAVFGPQWWHTSAVGHWFNGVHFWSVQAFMFFMVLHLWGMFFQGAWRDGRGRTWVMGGIAFLASIVAAFTGYLSQSNFDSQWIAVSAKDAINGTGLGGFFNVTNFGQMYSFHIIIFPLILVGLVGVHLVLVRLRGVVRPYPLKGEQRTPYTKGMTQEQYYQGVRMAPYDLLRELAIVGTIVTLLTIVLASMLSSPDEKPLTLQSVASTDPAGFVNVSLSELAGSSGIAQYGPPYNNANGSVQTIGPFSPQQLAGVHIPIDTAHAYVLEPLATVQSTDVSAAVRTFNAAGADQQTAWENAYGDAVSKSDGSLDDQGHLKVAAGDYGPLPVMFGALLDIARSGAMDGLLLGNGQFYQTDYTKPLLFLNEDALPNHAGQLNLQGSQWGMMNETGAYPGQAWLWLYTFWYQVPAGPFNGPNADIAVLLTMAVLTAILVFVPYIPGLRRIPEFLGVHRLIWRQYYAQQRQISGSVPAKAAG